jgi:hypothetical protein
MVEAARAHTLTRVAGRQVLVIQDTSSLRDRSNTTRRSLHLHAAIAVDAGTGSLLGLTDATFLHRSGGKRASTGTRPFAEKQSRRWLDTTIRAAALVQAGAASVTIVADREGDIYEEFALRPEAVALVIRAQQDRLLADGTLLSRCLDGVAELGRETIELPAGPGRRARTAIVALRARCVRIKAPKRAHPMPPTVPAEVAVWFVEAREVDPPAQAAPAHWLLLTTHPVPDLAAARRITAIYRQRWTIEQLFRTMKTVRERDGEAGQPLADAFDPADQPAMAAICASLEGKTARQKNPHPPDSMAWGSWICARLGGWNGYYGKPGPIVIHNGLLRLKTVLQGWNLRGIV